VAALVNSAGQLCRNFAFKCQTCCWQDSCTLAHLRKCCGSVTCIAPSTKAELAWHALFLPALLLWWC
jgi:hypothetical protein